MRCNGYFRNNSNMSALKRVKCNNMAEYAAALEENKTYHPNIFTLFTGTPNSSGVSWCPDCVAGKEIK